MTKTEPPSTRLCLVVATDLDEAGGVAFDVAARLARRAQGSELHLIHVFEKEPSQESARELTARLRLRLDEAAARIGGLHGVAVGIHVHFGTREREIAQLANDVRADLIVVASHAGPHLKTWLLGSTAERLLAGATGRRSPALSTAGRTFDYMTARPAHRRAKMPHWGAPVAPADAISGAWKLSGAGSLCAFGTQGDSSQEAQCPTQSFSSTTIKTTAKFSRSRFASSAIR